MFQYKKSTFVHWTRFMDVSMEPYRPMENLYLSVCLEKRLRLEDYYN